jgi:hypothetical protein
MIPGGYGSGSTATGRASYARRVKGDDPDKKGCPGPPGWGLGVGLTTSPLKKYCFETSRRRLRLGMRSSAIAAAAAAAAAEPTLNQLFNLVYVYF